MWGVGPVDQGAARRDRRHHHRPARRDSPGQSLERLLGQAAGEKLTALAWNRDPREIVTHRPRPLGRRAVGARPEAGRRPRSSGRRSAISPTASARRLRAKSLAGRTVTVRVRFADLRAVTRSR